MGTACERCGQDNPDEARFCRQCGGALPALDADRSNPVIGKMVLGRYEVVELVGEGGMGRVYMATQRVGTTTRNVAVKTLRAQLGSDPQVVKRFYREAETIVRLNHPNIIQLFDFGELDDGTLVIVMEFVAGRSLADALNEGGLGVERSDAILAQVCGALHEAHDLGIVHRDLKPDNILLTERSGRSDYVKVLDFGIAKISETDDAKAQSTKLTQQGMMVGTPPYMSPEQFGGTEVDGRSDIYSLGVIAYQMLTGRLPFVANTPWEWASKHLTAEPEPLQVSAQTGISERRAWAIQRALSKSPDDRQQDVMELLREFTEQGAASLPPHATALGHSQRPASAVVASAPETGNGGVGQNTDTDVPGVRPASRTKALLGAAAVLLICGTGFAFWKLGGVPAGSSDQLSAAASVGEPEPVPELPAIAPGPDAGTGDLGDARADARGDSLGERRGSQAARRPNARSKRRNQRGKAAEKQPSPAPSGTDAGAGDEGAAVETPPGEPAVPKRDAAADSNPDAAPSDPPQQSGSDGSASANPEGEKEVPADLAARISKAKEVARSRVEVAVGMYQAAVSKHGKHPALAPLAAQLQKRGARRARELIKNRRCAQAKALYRGMRAAKLKPPVKAFGKKCPPPK